MIKAISPANVTSSYNSHKCNDCKKPSFGHFEQESSTKKTLKRMGGQFVYGAVISGVFDAIRAGYNLIAKKPQQSLKSIGANAATVGIAFVAIDSIMNLYFKHKTKKIIEEQQKRPI